MDTLLLRYGEIFLKGGNRRLFVRKLVDNISKIVGVKAKKLHNRLVLDYFQEHSKLKRVFGLVSYSLCLRTDKEVENIKKSALKLLKRKKGTFKVAVKRSDKRFPIKSPEMNVLVGQYIEENSRLEFSFKTPDNILGIEINEEGAYLFFETVKCHGGLPTGVEGEVKLLVEDDDSVLAGLMFMKRGCNIIPVGFKKRKIDLLQKYSPVKLDFKIIKSLNEVEGILVSGQSFEGYKKYKKYKKYKNYGKWGGLLVFRPLIAYSEDEIKNTFEMF